MLCIGIISMGDMGSALGRSMATRGIHVVGTLEGRSENTRQRAQASGVALVPTVRDVIAVCDILLSVVPPAAATDLAESVAAQLGARPANRQPLIFADCNAITPSHSKQIGALIEAAGAAFVDGGIIGPPPGVGTPRLYVSGAEAEALLPLDGMGFAVRALGAEIGAASSLKLLFAGLNKGFNALSATMLTAAEKLNLGTVLESEIATMLPAFGKRIEAQMPYLPVNAARWIQEMQEIADLLSGIGLPEGYHRAAAETFELICKAHPQVETRETFDATRTARDVARTCAKELR